MHKSKHDRYKKLGSDDKSAGIQTAEVEKRTEAMSSNIEHSDKASSGSPQTNGRDEGSHKDRKRTSMMSKLRKKLEELENGVFNYMGVVETQHVNPPGGTAYDNNVRLGDPAVNAPDGQTSSRQGGGLSAYLARLKTDVLAAAGGFDICF